MAGNAAATGGVEPKLEGDLMMDREQKIRERANQIWDEIGRPSSPAGWLSIPHNGVKQPAS